MDNAGSKVYLDAERSDEARMWVVFVVIVFIGISLLSQLRLYKLGEFRCHEGSIN